MTDKREARILIVDDQRDTSRVLKTALELTNHGYFIEEVPSGEEAMLELSSKEFDIIVAEFRLPGMTGPELITRARKRDHGLKAVLISSVPMSEVKTELKQLGIEFLVGIFEKPIDTAAFSAAVDHALWHDTGTKTAVSIVEDEMGSIPEFDEGQVSAVMDNLLRDLGASSIVFSDRKGKMLITHGNLDQALRFSELAALLAFNFTTTAQISGYLGSQTSSAVHYYFGDWYDIYALSVGMHFFITIVFPGESQKQMGPVLRFGKTAVQDMIDIIGEGALTIPGASQSEAVVQTVIEAEPPVEDKKSRRGKAKEDEFEAPPVEVVPVRKKTAPLPVVANPIDIDLDSLDAELSGVGTGGEVDNFWEAAADQHEVLPEDSISREDAIALGLIPHDEEQS